MQERIDPKILKQYEIIDSLGKGAYGEVFMVKKNQNKKKYALKKLYEAFRNLIDSQRTYRELKYLNTINHPNIIKVSHCTSSMDGKDIYLQLELMKSDLSSLIKKNALHYEKIAEVFAQLVSAVYFLHKNQLIHRDIKPSNILIGDNLKVKLCDFGHVCRAPTQQRKLSEDIATRWYKAPQLLQGDFHYNKQVDIWGLGCTLAEMYSGKPIFPGASNNDQLKKISNAISPNINPSQPQNSLLNNITKLFPYGIDIRALQLLQKTLKIHPKQRYTIEQVIQHPFLEKYRSMIYKQKNNFIPQFYFEQIPSSNFTIMDYKKMVQQEADKIQAQNKMENQDHQNSKNQSKGKKYVTSKNKKNYNYSPKVISQLLHISPEEKRMTLNLRSQKISDYEKIPKKSQKPFIINYKKQIVKPIQQRKKNISKNCYSEQNQKDDSIPSFLKQNKRKVVIKQERKNIVQKKTVINQKTKNLEKVLNCETMNEYFGESRRKNQKQLINSISTTEQQKKGYSSLTNLKATKKAPLNKSPLLLRKKFPQSPMTKLKNNNTPIPQFLTKKNKH